MDEEIEDEIGSLLLKCRNCFNARDAKMDKTHILELRFTPQSGYN